MAVLFNKSMPLGCGLTDVLGKHYYCDSFEVSTQHNLTAKQAYYAIFAFLPKPIQIALRVRNKIVSVFGFEPSEVVMTIPLDELNAGSKSGNLTFHNVNDDEVICATKERHLDIWLSVQKVQENTYAVTTLVNIHTLLGQLYMLFIKPLHKLVASNAILAALKANRL